MRVTFESKWRKLVINLIRKIKKWTAAWRVTGSLPKFSSLDFQVSFRSFINLENVEKSDESVINQQNYLFLLWTLQSYPAGIYPLKDKNRNTKTKREICLKSTKKTPVKDLVPVLLLPTSKNSTPFPNVITANPKQINAFKIIQIYYD